MDNLYRFGSIEVFCEGYDYLDDPYILNGSCGLDYTLELTKEGQQKSHNYYGNSDSSLKDGQQINLLSISNQLKRLEHLLEMRERDNIEVLLVKKEMEDMKKLHSTTFQKFGKMVWDFCMMCIEILVSCALLIGSTLYYGVLVLGIITLTFIIVKKWFNGENYQNQLIILKIKIRQLFRIPGVRIEF